MRGSRHAWLCTLACAASLMVARRGGAAPQSGDQQRCINDVNKYGVRVARTQNRADLDCVRNAGRGLTVKLGVPPQAQTAQACLTNDVGGRVAKDSQKLADRDTRSCLTTPAQLP